MAWGYGDTLSLSTWGMCQSFTVTSYYTCWSGHSQCKENTVSVHLLVCAAYLLSCYLYVVFPLLFAFNIFLCTALLFPYHSFFSSFFIFLATQQLQTWRYPAPYHRDAWPPASPLHSLPLRHDVTIAAAAAALRLISCLLMVTDNTFHTVSACVTLMFPLRQLQTTRLEIHLVFPSMVWLKT